MYQTLMQMQFYVQRESKIKTFFLIKLKFGKKNNMRHIN